MIQTRERGLQAMEKLVTSREDEEIELPPGFRFHPTDEELISHYLSPKVTDNSFCARAIGEIDMNKCEPWDLPRRAKMGEKEWYFFCVRDRKYPTGLRTNRATDAGYWKATGKDKEICRAKILVGMKKTLVFYKGRAPKGEKTNWVMHEYRLEGKYSVSNLPKISENEWVICRVFQKNHAGKKIHISGFSKTRSYGSEFGPSLLPPLMDSPPRNSETETSIKQDLSHVTCFSNLKEEQKRQEDRPNSLYTMNSYILASSSSPNLSPASNLFSKASLQDSSFAMPTITNFQYPDHILMPEQSILRMLAESCPNTCRNMKLENLQETGLNPGRSFDDHEDPSSSGEPADLDCLW